ncbi:MAG TPA: heavy metal translocating P-type ATPase metal-binding domain-containing protein [Pedobacter sp.]|jgi:Cu+-exporting ATPase
MAATHTLTQEQCYHCGTEISQAAYRFDDKRFCCIGCQSVYQVLSSNSLCDYYRYNDTPGQTQKSIDQQYAYLDEDSITRDLVDFRNETLTVITFYIPSIHCSSCIWLLEHLHKLNSGVVHSRIDFLKKQVSVTFKHTEISLRALVELLISVGYEPLISLQDVVKEKKSSVNRQLIKKIAVAGLCMGNVMLFSFPEYFGLSDFESQFKSLFGWLNLAFAIPVTFYCAQEFFTSAWAALKNKLINLDAPLALIIAVLFLRTVFEITTQTGAGFTDTLTGLVFLLLMGRWLKQRTYYHLSYERDYRSYFPVAVTVLKDSKESSVALSEIVVGNRILIRNNEIIPADAILMKGEGFFDFSFVTGEAEPVRKVLGEIVYAGGRQVGEAVELVIIKPVSQSYLTNLWNNETFSSQKPVRNFNDSVAKYFSLATFLIALSATGYWIYAEDSAKAWNAFTSVLIVACPCVLSLSTPFTLSAVLRMFDKHQFFFKNTDAVEQLAKADAIVFDKTGTITSPDAINLIFVGELTNQERILAASLARNSSHPLSREIITWLKPDQFLSVFKFEEHPGKGITGFINNQEVVLGSRTIVLSAFHPEQNDSTFVHLEINGAYKGYFKINHQWRPGLKTLFNKLSTRFDLHLISGDNENERVNLGEFFPAQSQMRFKQSPHDKLTYIKHLQAKGSSVMMLGDGLNDAGALKQSDLGIAVTDNINNFSPACDGILKGESLRLLPEFIRQAKDAMKTIKWSFAIAIVYNLIGIYFAVQGILSPLTAAVLMPLSTITIIIFTSVCTRYYSFKNHLH